MAPDPHLEELAQLIIMGIDIAFPLGTNVLACESGTVTYAGENGALGKCVIINHGEGLQTVYGHMSKIKVMKGEKVRRSQPVGEVGNTGASTGPHLHPCRIDKRQLCESRARLA